MNDGWSHTGSSDSNPIAKDIQVLRSFVRVYLYRLLRRTHPWSFRDRRKGRKGTACLRARIGLDRLNVDLSQSANSQSPVLNLNIDLVRSLQVQCCVSRTPGTPSYDSHTFLFTIPSIALRFLRPGFRLPIPRQIVFQHASNFYLCTICGLEFLTFIVISFIEKRLRWNEDHSFQEIIDK